MWKFLITLWRGPGGGGNLDPPWAKKMFLCLILQKFCDFSGTCDLFYGLFYVMWCKAGYDSSRHLIKIWQVVTIFKSMVRYTKSKTWYFKLIRKSIMAAEKHKKNFLAESFCIFECLLTQKPTYQDSQLSWFF